LDGNVSALTGKVKATICGGSRAQTAEAFKQPLPVGTLVEL
jgi:hypothetical protein